MLGDIALIKTAIGGDLLLKVKNVIRFHGPQGNGEM